MLVLIFNCVLSEIIGTHGKFPCYSHQTNIKATHEKVMYLEKNYEVHAE